MVAVKRFLLFKTKKITAQPSKLSKSTTVLSHYVNDKPVLDTTDSDLSTLESSTAEPDIELKKVNFVNVKSEHHETILRNGGDSIKVFLKEHVLFKGLDEEFIELLSTSMQIRVYNDMDYVIKKGEVGRAMFFIKKGIIEVISEDGEMVINVMKEGFFFGEIGVLFSVPRTATCRSNGRSIALILTKEKFAKAMAACPQAARVISLLAQERFSSYIKQQESKVEIDFGDELNMAVTKDDLQNVPLFRDCQVGFLHMMAMSLKPVQYKQGDYIIKKGDIASEIYFVARGTAQIINEETGQSFADFQPGSFFGEVGILFEVNRTASIVCSSSIINVFKLTKVDMDKLLDLFPEVAEKIKLEAKTRFERHKNTLASLSKNQEFNVEIEVMRERLKLVPIFSDGSVGFLHQLALTLRLRKYKKDEIIIQKDTIGSSMFFIFDGTAVVINDTGNEIYAELSNGSSFGEVALFYDIARTATVKAFNDISLFELAKESFHLVLDAHPKFAKTLNSIAAENYNLFLERQKAVKQLTRRSNSKKAVAYDVEATAARLKAVPLFSNCDSHFLHSLALNTTIQSFVKNDIIIQKGTKSSSMFFIVEGESLVVSDDLTQTYDVVKEGGFFGEVGLVKGILRTATVKVSSDICVVLILLEQSLQNVMLSSKESYQAIVLESARRYDLFEKRNNDTFALPEETTESMLKKRSLLNNSAFRTLKKVLTDIPSKTKSSNFVFETSTSKLKGINKYFSFKDSSSNDLQNNSELRMKKSSDSLEKGRILVPSSISSTDNEKAFLPMPELRCAQSVSSSTTKSTIKSDKFFFKVSEHKFNRQQQASILHLDSYILYLIYNNLKFLDQLKLRSICKQWKEEFSAGPYWEKLIFNSMYRTLTKQILKHFCEISGSSLCSLELKNCFRITDTELKGLSLTCRNINDLSLLNCWTITDKGVRHIAKNLTKLKSLDLSYCSQIIGVGFYNHQWTGLKKVDLSFCKLIGDNELEILLSKATEMKQISLRRCSKITDFGLFLIVRYCRVISSIDISDCNQLAEKSLKIITSGCSLLTSLNLTFCTKISSAGIFEVVLASKNLTNLTLNHCTQLTENSIISFLSKATTVKYLSIRGCKTMTDAGVIRLIRCSNGLKEINCTACPDLTQDLIVAVKNINPCIKLTMDKPAPKNIGKKKAGAKKIAEIPLSERFTNLPRKNLNKNVKALVFDN
ncbi:hypothetical protein HDU92_008224 [Lobulomyces angularis]|nr:hypothetical protein HDU92_008224 [Lobulomyces angularis]